MANKDGRPDAFIIGVDVGSTTVKATAVDPESKRILWSDYQRHHTKQAEKVLELLIAIGNAFPDIKQENIRVFTTGSGSGPIAPHIGAKFVQEVNAVTMAVEHLHPDVGSVIELGGQDAKIIIFKENEETGNKQAITSMNDKCASGTGATIDKCMIKVGLPMDEVGRLHFDDSKLHHVAAKCGVFAETDIVNLVKSGIPSTEIMCSLADAIVMQNLSVLTRGNTLRHRVLLLGGPNTYLPFLQECWRKRIPKTWEERGYDYPQDVPIDELIFVPDNSQYYAAYGAVMYGMHEPAGVGSYTGLEGLKEFIAHGRKAKLGENAGPALTANKQELEQFRSAYRIPAFNPASFASGQNVKAVIGLDGGSTSSKAVLVDKQGTILMKEYQLSKGNPLEDTKEMLKRIRDKIREQGAELEIIGFGATGYAADVLEKTLKTDVNIVETVAHMMSAVNQFGDIDVICDIGGQDIKVLFLKNGDIRNFRLSNQCSAGNGMLLQAMADQFGIPIQEYADTAFAADLSPKYSYGCAVFLDADRVNFQKEGYSKEELLAGLALVLPKNVWQYVVQIPRMAELGRKFVLQGGTQYNLAAVKAQVDYIKQRVPDAEVYVHPHPGEAGAIGAAMETLRVVKRRGYSTFLGLDAAIDLTYLSRNDESTRCNFCPNHCSRTFIDSRTPDGNTARYISGFSCEKGTVEDQEAVVKLTRERQELKKHYPNLVEYEARRMYQRFYDPAPLPEPVVQEDDAGLKRGRFGFIGRRKSPNKLHFERSSAEAAERRKKLRIGIPRVLNIWSTAPFWRTYFETLGIDQRNIVFSDYTSEEMWQQGGKYGSIDPCYPSKVAQAHVHNLLFKHHEQKPLEYIFFPCITHIPTHLQNVMDSTSCPIVAGAPNVIKAAFTKEVNFFETRGVAYLDPAVTFTEPNFMKKQLFEAFRDHLQITEDESGFAADQGWEAMHRFDAEMQEKGRMILEQVEQENRLAILLIGRPYHSDPGLNHSVLEEFQVLGYPILSMRSIPKDEAWLRRFFEGDLQSGRVEHALEVSDVWPENFSSNSVQKVWAAKFAARHPNVAVLDLSSFKCGHDAPTYGLIDSIISAAGTPYSALHDIDANKPSGSIKIRVKTYAHSLGLHEERLEDLARKKAELQQRIEKKRAELQTRKHDEQAGVI
ncbi:MAG TPA: BadF/BadG/BcrA/BcrD ATPase family protein [Paenibacillus sp.]|uniref:BadF/BadG/BcrA/BcrD ATPase family protein n=1 Tax=Paenibacillus sp. TaxID=58172 RepID=UPI002CC15982|nr:BadF/BadG/BcrA/BcrD ATPase family protein [Paenibacillus sp.]HUC92486.1 BadF/BadG/BcrA/BcrD ATPase family protein [Paenibacillus sp.]